MDLQANYRWTLEHFLTASELHDRTAAGVLIWTLYYSVGGLLLSLGIWIFVKEGFHFFSIVPTLLGAYLLLLRRLLNRILLTRHWKKRPDRDKKLNFEISEENLSLSSELGQGTVRWEAFAKATQGRDGLLLYANDKMFH